MAPETDTIIRELTRKIERLEGRLKELERENELLRQQAQELAAQNGRLRQQLEEAQRAAARPAAPFRVPEPRRKQHPKRPGRKAGHPGARRPEPEVIDETIEVPLEHCPHCQGPLEHVEAVEQIIEEIPEVRPRIYRVRTYVGHCPRCGKVRSTHPLQTSTASGAAKVQLGPRALALGVELVYRHGLTRRRACAVLEALCGLKLSPGGLVQAAQRLAVRLGGDYEALIAQLRQAAVVHADETGWWVAGAGWFLWVFTRPELTVYRIVAHRERAEFYAVLGLEFAGVLVSDCLNIYDDVCARQHKCYAHHLKAIAQAQRLLPRSEYLGQVRGLLLAAMILKELAEEPEADAAVLDQDRQRLEARADALLLPARASPVEEAVANRLRKQRDHLFTFLAEPEVEATNNLAERQLRPAVISRKLSAGNKSQHGAHTWEVLASVAVSCAQRAASFVDKAIGALRRFLPTPQER